MVVGTLGRNEFLYEIRPASAKFVEVGAVPRPVSGTSGVKVGSMTVLKCLLHTKQRQLASF